MEVTIWQPRVIVDEEVFPMVFQGQVLFLFGIANHQLHAVKELVMGI